LGWAHDVNTTCAGKVDVRTTTPHSKKTYTAKRSMLTIERIAFTLIKE
jgi:hypothetical protein